MTLHGRVRSKREFRLALCDTVLVLLAQADERMLRRDIIREVRDQTEPKIVDKAMRQAPPWSNRTRHWETIADQIASMSKRQSPLLEALGGGWYKLTEEGRDASKSVRGVNRRALCAKRTVQAKPSAAAAQRTRGRPPRPVGVPFQKARERADAETDLPSGGQRWRVAVTLAGRTFERAVVDVASPRRRFTRRSRSRPQTCSSSPGWTVYRSRRSGQPRSSG